MKFFTDLKHKPLEVIIGLCVFTIALGGGCIKNAASSALAVMFLISLGYIQYWRASWRQLDQYEKALCYGFVLFTLSGALSYINTDDSNEFIKQMGRYIRFTLIIPVYLMMRWKRLDVSAYLLAGVVASGFLYLGFALNGVHARPELPASGYYHHITFGDAIMLNAGIMGLLLLDRRRGWIMDAFIIIAALCALYASLLSQARGAWIVLPVYLVIYITQYAKNRSAALKMVTVAAVAMMLLMLTPAGDVIQKRYDEAVVEIGQFANGDRFDTSIGGRISMWDIAYQVWKEDPLTGSGLGDFDEDIMRYQAMGQYAKIDVHGSAHNIFVQALVSTGLIGALALCYALLIAPLRLFMAQCKIDRFHALAGTMVVVSYAIFGMSESWILRAPAISIFMGYVVVLSSYLFNASDRSIG